MQVLARRVEQAGAGIELKLSALPVHGERHLRHHGLVGAGGGRIGAGAGWGGGQGRRGGCSDHQVSPIQ